MKYKNIQIEDVNCNKRKKKDLQYCELTKSAREIFHASVK